MATELRSGTGVDGRVERRGPTRGPTTTDVWRALSKGSFAVLSHVTPSGEPRSSGVMYRVIGRTLYVVVGDDSWKARHIERDCRVAVTVPVRRGGPLSLALPIPPATISFYGTATVHRPGSAEAGEVRKELAALIPPDRRDSACAIAIVPEGDFVTYALGVPLRRMRDPVASRGRAPTAGQ